MSEISLKDLSFSIKEIENILRTQKRNLGSDDISLVRKICSELARNKEGLKEFFEKGDYLVEEVAYMFRIKLYKSDEIEIRAHLFHENENEPYIHQHRHYFITNCLSGGYIHNLYRIFESDQNYYVYIRGENGVFNEVCSEVRKGKFESIINHEFKMGQSLFLSPYPYHTVVQNSKERLITLVVRNAKDEIKNVEFIHTAEKLSNIPKKAVRIENLESINEIIDKFIKALENFSECNI